MGERVWLREVGPRDGLQNEPGVIATEIKVELVERLMDAGVRFIEVSSFVHPKWIPQLADADEVFARIRRRPGVELSALVPNERGLARALAAKVDAVHVFMSASESHNLKNINKTIADTYPVLRPVIEGAKAEGLVVRGYVSTVFGCPYEGKVPVSQVLSVVERLFELGVDEVALGDTIGVAVPTQVAEVVREVERIVPLDRVSLHFHDTRGMAIANMYAGFAAGVRRFDGSIGGLGGCPYAPGASGNVAMEDVLYLFNGMDVETGIEAERYLDVVAWLESKLNKPLASHARQVARSACQAT
ncbi:hydroxymethylglutaryl-CoA lyase [Alicyclobacillus acidocaldarius]|uniref:Pyruvate carboxyltransferase n=1 Tax=Alicyclobacillus acidocaldarius subsp. acidocaldarius (strain ATCC 27009 / DSM 446 / BCRC 14685 / JCM 5260 / KCTC 1825 / NBRC 15652 / NCIMB 11725 / NRRL B-14509 / 104-IA) TaxID=521098 RepID=C8WQC0_ALIAD|nr:hydroxymethylglutaryl-CoA lyase [Alicyclobacillus acidocaldarius]ACV59065.1 pyruvate carboxyltransferase [Alicyclobacillus acidocaldarius subsp. acidocaldarius DSM 446]